MVEAKVEFAIESTLSGLLYAKRIKAWKMRGYLIEIVCLRLAAPRLALSRVAARVKCMGEREGRRQRSQRRGEIVTEIARQEGERCEDRLLPSKNSRATFGADPPGVEVRETTTVPVAPRCVGCSAACQDSVMRVGQQPCDAEGSVNPSTIIAL